MPRPKMVNHDFKRDVRPYRPNLIIHGGAGAISRSNLPPELYEQYHASLLTYLTSTKALLDSGATAVDAACHAVSLMEDDPLFNCGRGSVFTTAGQIEMEASLAVTSVDPHTRFKGEVKRSAAVSMVRQTRHPILLAREVLEMADEDHGFGGTAEMHGHLSGEQVEAWGGKRGLEKKDRSWFWTKRRWEEHRRGLYGSKAEKSTIADTSTDEDSMSELPLPSQGTVGAVCMDSWGTIATATSTGGLTNKLPGRIGDTPTVGAGFWAESWAEEVFRELGIWHRAKSLLQDMVRTVSRRFEKSMDSHLRATHLGAPRYTRLPKSHRTSSMEKILAGSNPQMQESKNVAEPVRHRAVAMSGTGNGDSFLRISACRTAAAKCLSTPSSSTSLAEAIHIIAGPGGELQKSAGERWGRTGEGQGGIIGIELFHTASGEHGHLVQDGRVVFDFNCGGMWRAYYEIDHRGEELPFVRVFREPY